MERLTLVVIVLAAACTSEASPTWSADIAPLLETSCTGCHREEGIAPFAFRSYGDAASRAHRMAELVGSRQMPPFPPDASGACNTYESARLLHETQRDMVVSWAAAGAPEGEPGRAVEPAAPPSLDDGVLVAPRDPYTPAPDETNVYRCFFVDPGLTEDAFVTAFDARPGEPRIVHHVILYSLPDAATEDALARLDAVDDEPGYTCVGDAGHPAAEPVAGWAPGAGVATFPAGTGLRLAAGRRLVLQMHYHPNGEALSDHTEVALRLVSSVDRPARYFPLYDSTLEIPPRSRDVVVSKEVVLAPGADEMLLWGAFPHMHTLGTSIRLELTPLEHDDPVCVLDVPRWDFEWQDTYFFREPTSMRAGDRLRLTCVYDNPGAEPVVWGSRTEDEMCLAFLYVTGG